jgi:hypothetical protein
MQWGDQWLTGKGHEPRLLQDRSTGDRVAPVEIRTTKGAKVVADDLSFVPGPGAHSPRPRGKGLIVRGRSKKKAARAS